MYGNFICTFPERFTVIKCPRRTKASGRNVFFFLLFLYFVFVFVSNDDTCIVMTKATLHHTQYCLLIIYFSLPVFLDMPASFIPGACPFLDSRTIFYIYFFLLHSSPVLRGSERRQARTFVSVNVSRSESFITLDRNATLFFDGSLTNIGFDNISVYFVILFLLFFLRQSFYQYWYFTICDSRDFSVSTLFIFCQRPVLG